MRPHGTKQRWNQGCRCDECRKAWNKYNWERTKARRKGDWRGSVPIKKARKHILELGSQEAVARISGVHRMVISRIVNRKVTGIYKRTEDAILAVTKRDVAELWPVIAHNGSFLPLGPSMEMLAVLKRSGFTDAELGRKANIKTGLRVLGKKYIRAYNARRIEQLYRKAELADKKITEYAA